MANFTKLSHGINYETNKGKAKINNFSSITKVTRIFKTDDIASK